MKNWIMFGLLGLIWGSSFLLIKIGLTGLDAFSLVSGRLVFAAIAFTIFAFITHRRLPTDRDTLIKLAIVGLTNTAIPFVLITWGESSIDSGLAGVLDATAPLFSLLIAHLALADEKITLGKILGLIAGFAGVIVLAMRTADPLHPNPIIGQLAVIVASVCYGGSAVFIRRSLRKIDPLVVPWATLLFGASVVVVLALVTVHPLPILTALEPKVILSVITLGVINTFVAYAFFFTLIQTWGATRATTVAYLLPPVSVLLGVLVEHEPFDVQLMIGTVMILGGVALTNLIQPRPQPMAELTSPEPLP
ncbi:MAG: DMT family transporter [Chloroflexota bacterium]